MKNPFPFSIVIKSIITYLLALMTVALIYPRYALDFQWVIFGVTEVFFFFYYSQKQNVKWIGFSQKKFCKTVFYTALIVRIAYVIFSYAYFDIVTGRPFEFDVGDSMNYHWKAQWILEMFRTNNIKEYNKFLTEELSDAGYASYLAFVYFLTEESIIIVRLLKAVWGALICLLVYKLASRNFGENIGRLSAVFCIFMPNLVYYCGLHLKEIEMTFLTVFFVERADFYLRQKSISFAQIVFLLFIAAITFAFRTALGVVLFIAFGLTVFFTSKKIISVSKRILIGLVSLIFILSLIWSNLSIRHAIQETWNASSTEQKANMEWRARRSNGNAFAKYAGAAVFAPLIFTIPFPTIVETPQQENQKIINGGNYCKNVFSFFTIVSVFALFLRGEWRKNVLMLSVFIGYLTVLVFSSFAQSERFHLPILPFSMIMFSYGIYYVAQKRKMIFFNYWLIFIFIAIIAWSWFKLAGRGLVSI